MGHCVKALAAKPEDLSLLGPTLWKDMTTFQKLSSDLHNMLCDMWTKNTKGLLELGKWLSKILTVQAWELEIWCMTGHVCNPCRISRDCLPGEHQVHWKSLSQKVWEVIEEDISPTTSGLPMVSHEQGYTHTCIPMLLKVGDSGICLYSKHLVGQSMIVTATSRLACLKNHKVKSCKLGSGGICL